MIEYNTKAYINGFYCFELSDTSTDIDELEVPFGSRDVQEYTDEDYLCWVFITAYERGGAKRCTKRNKYEKDGTTYYEWVFEMVDGRELVMRTTKKYKNYYDED